MSRCSNIMKMQHDIHPTVLSTLEGIVDQVSNCFGIVYSNNIKKINPI